ncbi:hypothetical protein SS50377_25017 [Spironucleus salmonicida]|uniref:Uncharacterized protein n=1 Tax=Spironucleus salmonicida TaxID=348837 RepID=A0A9P8RXV6_9EUKA|nr:hypothetical protein SS50377_25017 [Spironucleus salmonicida]
MAKFYMVSRCLKSQDLLGAIMKDQQASHISHISCIRRAPIAASDTVPCTKLRGQGAVRHAVSSGVFEAKFAINCPVSILARANLAKAGAAQG